MPEDTRCGLCACEPLKKPEWRDQDSNLGRTVPCGLQPHPFDRSGIPPRAVSLASDRAQIGLRRAPRDRAGSGSPGSISKAAYFGPPRRSPEPPPSSDDGIYQRRPSPTWANTASQREASRSFTTPLQLWLPPRVARVQLVPTVPEAGRRLHLHPHELPVEVGDRGRSRDCSKSGLRTRRRPARVNHAIADNSPRFPWPLGRPHVLHTPKHTFATGRTAGTKRSPTTRRAGAAPRAAPRASSACGSRSGGSARGSR